MINGGQIAQGAITDNKVGKNANIKYSKLDKANEGEVLVAQGDGRLKAVRISGDARMSTTGRLTVTAPEVDIPDVSEIDKRFLRKTDLKEGKTLVGGPVKPEEVPVGSGANAIPQRDSSGNLKAETADLATNATNADNATTADSATTATTATNADNADLLDDQEGTYYLDVTNHTAQGTATSLGVPENSVGISSANKQGFPKIVYEANTGGGSNSYFTIPHALGYIPQVTIMHGVTNGGSTVYKEIDAEVESSTSQTVVRCSEQGLNLKVYLT